ncbi:rhamnulose-1-phosphate aldolase [uncultured Draconibacterium sp.]|uniref:rhamnulose-1-phosphate aldolase n=1 Tax=uncultured Draconibacterium sp. TaxID=1573823 RepID=UPI0029C61279|nr:rhamnulose-1-phosphate aldolase [uncultured Draconibacterium sp.]
MNEFDKPLFIREIIKTSHDMHIKGWTEANGGNISLRLREEFVKEVSAFEPQSDWTSLNGSVPGLANDYFLVSGTGRFLRNISLFPEKNVGIIQLDDKGENYRILWGYEGGSRPTSELFAHLMTHEVRKKESKGVEHAVIHTHTPNLIALTYHKEYTTAEISYILWAHHVECAVVFPEGVFLLPWMMAGSYEIGRATADAMKVHRMVIWQHHGIFASGRNLDESFGLIHTAEKSAEIFIKANILGGVNSKPDLERLQKIAENFGKKLNPDLVKELNSKT